MPCKGDFFLKKEEACLAKTVNENYIRSIKIKILQNTQVSLFDMYENAPV